MCELNLINKIDQLDIQEINELICRLQNKFNFNISLHDSIQTNEKVAENPINFKFKVTLSSVNPDKKISVLKTVKSILNLGLKESKDIIEQLPSVIKQDITLEEANELKIQLENAGGIVNMEKIIEL